MPSDSGPASRVAVEADVRSPHRQLGRHRLARPRSAFYIRKANSREATDVDTEGTGVRDRLQAALGAGYTLERELGGGGMSRVFVATETALGRKVVVKVLPPDLAEGVSVERFKREIQLAAQLQHPHIVPVHAAGETGGLPYYTMPLVDGASLRERLAAGPRPIGEVISVLRDVAKALAYAHERGVVHRDIKPDNVLLTGGSAVVTDFGVAKALSASKRAAPGGTLTQVGTSLGTPAYMAPEQAAGDSGTDHRADVYAFGVMAYEMLAGHPPFHGRTAQKLLAAQMAERPQPVAELRPDTPPLLADLVMRCLEKEPDDRPQSAADLVRVLETVTSGGGHPTLPAILLGGRRRLTRALALYAVAFVAVTILAKAAIVGIGLPDWVFPGAVVVMALGLPVILFTALVHHGAHQAFTAPELTPGGSPVTASTMGRLAVRASPWVTWRRTAMGGMIAMGAFTVLVIGFMVLRALGIGPAGSLLAAGKLAHQQPLLVADFRARGADSALGSVVSEAVRTDLGQSSAVSVVPTSVVAAALGRMRRPAGTRVDLPLAREIAAREGIRAIVDGDVTPLGAGYIVAVRLVAPATGDELASYRETAGGPGELLPTVDKLTRKLRGKIGESLRAVHASPPLAQVTTPSLEALRRYVTAVRATDFDGDYPNAIRLLQEALALDTTFAMAYRKLSVALGNIGAPRAQVDTAAARAYRYRDRLTERERDLAVAGYFGGGPGRDRRQEAAAYEALLARDSLDDIAVNNYANILASRRQFARAESLYQRSIASRRAGEYEYSSIIQVRINQGRLAAAETSVAAGRAALPANPFMSYVDVWVLYARGQRDSVAVRLAQVRNTTADAIVRARVTHRLADLALLRGRLAESQRLRADGWAQDTARAAPPPPLVPELTTAWVDIWFRERPRRGAEMLDTALVRTPLRSLPESDRPYLWAAKLYALAGRPDRARTVLAQYTAEVRDSALRRESEPELHNALAEVALAEGRPRDALTQFRLGDRLPDGPANECTVCLQANLARAFDRAALPDSAIVMFERYIATPFWQRLQAPFDAAFLAGTYKRLGELYEAKGERQTAAGYYLKFVELWKNADPELQPKVAEARRRLATLSDVERR